jgi:hypothetical protein
MNARRAVDPSAFDSGIWGVDSVGCPPDPILAAHVDGEISGARSTLLEHHLDRCRVCAAEVRRLEGLSGLLRAWDAARPEVMPPQRLATRILRDVEVEVSVRRAHAAADARRSFLAVAASILLVGGACALGFVRSPSEGGAEGANPAAVAVTAAVETVAGDRPSLVVSRPALRGVEFDATAVEAATARMSAPGAAIDLSVLSDPAATQAFARHAYLWDVERRYGETFVLSPDGRALATPTLESFERTRRRAEWIASRARRLAEPDTRDASDTGVPLARLLPVPQDGDTGGFLSRGARVEEQATPARGGIVLRAIQGSAPVAAAGGDGDARVLDLSEAVRSGAVRLLEDATPAADAVVIQVLALDAPILIPAGEILSGGLAPRAVARGVWLPAGRDVYPVKLSCRAIGPVARVARTPLVPTGLLAGPELRGALARGETPAGIVAIVRAQLRGAALDAEGSSADLVRLYEDGGSDTVARARRLLDGLGGATAFVATDPSGRLQGVESVRLPPAASRALLERLIAGYLAESGSRSSRDAPRMGVQAEDVFSVLSSRPVRVSAVPATGRGRSLRVWSGDEPRNGVVFEAIPGDGDGPALSSVLVPDIR